MRQQFMNHSNDVQWLIDTKPEVRPYAGDFDSFVLYGNEDSPDKVELYSLASPTINDTPIATIDFNKESS